MGWVGSVSWVGLDRVTRNVPMDNSGVDGELLGVLCSDIATSRGSQWQRPAERPTAEFHRSSGHGQAQLRPHADTDAVRTVSRPRHVENRHQQDRRHCRRSVFSRATPRWSGVREPRHCVCLCLREGTGSHFVTQRPSDPGIQRPGDPVDPVTLLPYSIMNSKC